MKKIICIAAAVLCAAAAAPLPAYAIEAGTYEERAAIIREMNTAEFPDPDARFTEVTEGDFVYRLYSDFAVLADVRNTEITAAEIPAAVQELPVVGIVDEPFRFCRNLTSITLPDGFTHFRWDHLINTFSVEAGSDEDPMPTVQEVLVSENNPDFTVEGGMLYSKDLKMLIGCPPALAQKELHISEAADSIGEYAFFACMDLEKAVVPDNIQHIHCNAFTACMNLEYAELPPQITKISGDTFFFCKNLKTVVMHGAVDTIGYGAFHQCTALTDFSIPETVTQIGWKAFEDAGCCENAEGLHYVQNWLVGSDSGVTEIRPRTGTDSIAEMALAMQSQISYIDVPASVCRFGNLTFSVLSPTVSSQVHFRAAELAEHTVSNMKNAADIYIYDTDCAIFDSEKTIPAAYTYKPQDGGVPDPITLAENPAVTGDVVIHGYTDSTAQAYAEKYGRIFQAILPSGDITGDGYLKVSDIVMLQKNLLGDSEEFIPDWRAADLNQDGKLTGVDLSLMLRMLSE